MEHSLFFRLSPELRNLIYEYTFTSRYKHHLSDSNCQHSLTKTCHQIRQETLAMFYTHTRFNAHLDDRSPAPLLNWLKTIGLQPCLLIRELNVWGMHDVCLTLRSLPAAKAYISKAGQGAEVNMTNRLDSTLRMQSGAVTVELQRVTAQSCRVTDYLSDVVDCLEAMEGVVVRQMCIVGHGSKIEEDFGLTSDFAVMTSKVECD